MVVDACGCTMPYASRSPGYWRCERQLAAETRVTPDRPQTQCGHANSPASVRCVMALIHAYSSAPPATRLQWAAAGRMRPVGLSSVHASTSIYLHGHHLRLKIIKGW